MKAKGQELGLQRTAKQSGLVGMLGAPGIAAAQRPRCAGAWHWGLGAQFCVVTGSSGQRDLLFFWGGSISCSNTTRISTGQAILSYLQLFI